MALMLQRLNRAGARSLTWLRTHRRFLLISLGIALALISVIQLAYPQNRPLPRQKIGGQSVSAQPPSALAPKLTDREKALILTLESKANQHTVSWREAGVVINTDATLKKASDYPLWQRVIPLSSVYRAAFTDTSLQTTIDNDALTAYANDLSKNNSQAPVDATLSVKDGKVVRQSHKDGLTYDAATITKLVQTASLKPDTKLTLEGKESKAAVDLAKIEPTAKKAEAILDTQIALKINGETKATIPNTDIGSWMQFKQVGQELTIEFDKAKIAGYIDSQGKSAYKAPGQTTIVLQDGIELQRSPEQKGQAVNAEQGASALSTTLLAAKTTTVEVPLKELPPKYNYQRSYTKSSRGLNVLLQDLTNTRPNMAIALRALDGSGISANARGNKGYNPASTYKTLVAVEALKRVEQGSLQMSTSVGGRSLDNCIQVMIVNSDNDCAKALGDMLGWSNLTNAARGLGMGGTQYGSGANFTSTASDQTLLLSKLQSGELLSSGNQNLLLGHMKSQQYRQGIPKGVGGSAVADKPGFIGGILHDAAIVYGPRGPYVLTIYSSSGSSWADIASVTGTIHEVMSR